MKKHKIAVIVGSLRKESLNLKTAKALISVAPESFTFDIITIGDLPYYNEDIEANPPKEWQRFRKEIAAADGILFVTPEYNRSVPAVLKNAIDVGSRPYGKNVWNEKPAAIVSVSIGDRKSTRLNSSHVRISYAVFCLKKKNINNTSVFHN